MVLFIYFQSKKYVDDETIALDYFFEAEFKIITYIQNIYFSIEMDLINSKSFTEGDPMLRLNPILGCNVLRLGGRPIRLEFPFDEKGRFKNWLLDNN